MRLAGVTAAVCVWARPRPRRAAARAVYDYYAGSPDASGAARQVVALRGRAYRGGVRSPHRTRRGQAHLVTEAQVSKSADIAYRQRRYLIMMGIRAVCFVVAVVLYVSHVPWWLIAILVAGAIFIPYFAVIFANAGREPTSTRGFRPYQPNLPERYAPPAGGRADPRESGNTGTSDDLGVPPRNTATTGETGHQESAETGHRDAGSAASDGGDDELRS